MPVPFLDLKKQTAMIRDEVESEFREIIDTGWFVLGPKVEAFENGFAELCGARHCIAVSSGTAAVHLGIWSCDLPRGSGIMVPANTFIATSEAITLAGQVPVFVDVCPDTYNLSPTEVEGFISENRTGDGIVDPKSGATVRGIVAVDLYGQVADLPRLQEIADENGLALVEDACQAHGAHSGSGPAGSFGNAAAFSFYPGKNMGSWGEGGAVTTNSDETASRIRMLRDHGSAKKYHHDVEGHNYRMSAFQGAALGVKLKYIDQWNDGRRAAAARYAELLQGVDLELPVELDGNRHVYHLYAAHANDRDALRDALGEQGIGAGLHYPIPLHLQPAYAHLGYERGELPVCEYNADHNITLPMFPDLAAEQQEEVARAVAEILSK